MLAKKLIDLSFSSTSARIAQVILQGLQMEPKMIDAPPRLAELSQRQIAELAGTVRVVAARALRSFADAGAVELERGRIVRVRPRRLSTWV
jgi:Crp-like helix-turn-helix domain